LPARFDQRLAACRPDRAATIHQRAATPSYNRILWMTE
jgi:hypothetical protein